MSTNLLQQLNSIPNVSGNGVPVQTYANTMQKILTQEMTTVPNQQIATLASTTSALNSVETALQQLQTATQTLASAQTWTPTSVTSSDSSLFTVDGGTGAPLGAYGVTVSQLANYQVTSAQTSLTSATSAGEFAIYGGSTATGTPLATISVTSGESLSDIVTAINQDSSKTGVQAFIMNGDRLSLESTKSGTTGAFSVADVTGNFISSQTDMQLAQTAQNAQISFAGTTVSSSTNAFSNIIPGVTLTAVAKGSGTMNVSQDTSGVVKDINNWMSAYNSVVDLLSKDTQYTPPATGTSGGTAGPLSGDPAATGLMSQLPNSINTLMPPTTSSGNDLAIGTSLTPGASLTAGSYKIVYNATTDSSGAITGTTAQLETSSGTQIGAPVTFTAGQSITIGDSGTGQTLTFVANTGTMFTASGAGNYSQTDTVTVASGTATDTPTNGTFQGTMDSLASIGIVLNPNNGHLEWQSSSGFKINGKDFAGSLQDGQTMFQNALTNNLSGVEALFGVVPDTTLKTVIPTSGVLNTVNNVMNEFLGFGSTKGIIPTEMDSISSQTNSLNQYLKQVQQTINNQVSNFTSQLNALNASLAKSQQQMETIQSLFGLNGSGSSSGSGSSGGSSSSSGSSSSGS